MKSFTFSYGEEGGQAVLATTVSHLALATYLLRFAELNASCTCSIVGLNNALIALK